MFNNAKVELVCYQVILLIQMCTTIGFLKNCNLINMLCNRNVEFAACLIWKMHQFQNIKLQCPTGVLYFKYDFYIIQYPMHISQHISNIITLSHDPLTRWTTFQSIVEATGKWKVFEGPCYESSRHSRDYVMNTLDLAIIMRSPSSMVTYMHNL